MNPIEAAMRRCLLVPIGTSVLLATACHSGPRTYEECVDKAFREARNDRQFHKLVNVCREQYKKR